MHDKIYEKAIELGYVNAVPVTGHPFEVWYNKLKSTPLGQYLSFEHDPLKISGWSLDETTVWVAIAPTPPLKPYPEGYGEIGSFYICSQKRRERRIAWQKATIELGVEIISDVTLPERAAAIRAGLGVHGLNGLLIAPDYGSFVDITVLLVRVAPPQNARGQEYDLSPGCGNCGDCIKACPTNAISEEGVNSVICLRSYMNYPEYMPETDYSKMGCRILGCEICQLVCPKNSNLVPLEPPSDIINCLRLESLLIKPDVEHITKYVQIDEALAIRQAILAAANTDRKDLIPLIQNYIGSDDEVIDKFARWAVNHLQ
jgi:epoxyqueuosine reductase